jgi:hypothetical protein
MRRLIAGLAGVVLVFGIGEVRGAFISVNSAIEAWQDSGVDIIAGQTLNVTASGIVFYQGYNPLGSPGYVNPDGVGIYNDGTQQLSDTILPSTIALTLIGKVGGTTDVYSATGTPVPEGVLGKGEGFVGSSYSQQIPNSGRLFFAFNDELHFFVDNVASFKVTFTVVPEPSAFGLLCMGAAGLAFYARRRLVHHQSYFCG